MKVLKYKKPQGAPQLSGRQTPFLQVHIRHRGTAVQYYLLLNDRLGECMVFLIMASDKRSLKA
uniref:Uncharacterized protein n=1 Tax=Tolypothrix bouteillei VB521301 TaxID=1479485 RepID=A0A0C1REN1_9CYAN